MIEEQRKDLKQAIELKNQGDNENAINLLKASEEKYGKSSKSTALIAMILNHNLKRIPEALIYARQWIELSPKNETASVNLVHALFDMGKHKEVDVEIRRFIKTGVTLKEYKLLFKENGVTKKDFI
jgi:tetratricopeptide (TPR) repeat protein